MSHSYLAIHGNAHSNKLSRVGMEGLVTLQTPSVLRVKCKML